MKAKLMARSSYIYHFYIEGRWMFSGTVKHEVLWNIYNKEYDKYINARLIVSGDNSEGESEVLGWRPRPKEGDDAILIDGFLHEIKEVLCLNPNGSWKVKLKPKHDGWFTIKWNLGLNRWEEYETPKKSRKRLDNEETI